MTCAADLFTSLLALHTADSGAGGLTNSTGAQYAPYFFRVGDADNRGLNKPRIEVEIIEDETDRFTKNSIEVLIRYHLFTDSNARYGSGDRHQNAVLNRMRTVFHRVAVGAQSLWTFSETAFSGVAQAPVNLANNELHAVVNARLTARSV